MSGDYSVSGRRLQRMVNGFSIMAAILIVLVIICLITFVLIDQLTLTILSNNFALILGTVTSNLLLLRIHKIKSQIIVDQHKAVMYESARLLRYATHNTKQASQSADGLVSETMLFLNALEQTELFMKPLHIEIDEQYDSRSESVKGSRLQIMSHI